MFLRSRLEEMADERACKRDQAICVKAFKEGNRLVARQILSRISQPATVTTTFPKLGVIGHRAEVSLLPTIPASILDGIRRSTEVSLLHLAAYWGWIDVVTELVSVHGCSIVCKDDCQHFPLHYAAFNGHLEVIKYFFGLMGNLTMIRPLGHNSPLYLAFCNGQMNMVEYLIKEALRQ